MGSLHSSAQTAAMSSSEIQVSLRGKVLDTSQKLEYGEVEAWTPFNSDLQMQGIKVLVTAPLPDQKKGDMFEGTMLLLGMIKDKQENENKRMKDEMIREMALEKKRKNEQQNKNNI